MNVKMTFREPRTLDVLEWDDIQNELSNRTQTNMGAKKALSWIPGLWSFEQAARRARATLQIFELRKENQIRLPLLDIPDLGDSLKRIARGAMIGVEDFANLLRFHKSVQSLAQFPLRYASKKADLLQEMAGFETLEEWSRKHTPMLDNQGQMADAASEDLRALRKLYRDLKERIQRKLEDYLQNPKLAELMQDFYVTLRDGRYVLPIKNNFKGRVPGIIHDVSNSEQTFFVEPQEVVELNNQLKVVEKEIEAEIERILQEVVENTKPYVGVFSAHQEKISILDVLNAASLLVESWGEIPVCAMANAETPIFKDLRHPLLSLATKVVPHSFDFAQSLILTGPNTGGKTVLLKTLGLAYCLAWAGFPVPAQSFMVPPNFFQIFADIGDDQDLGQNLSTFSGHLRVLKNIYEEASAGDWVLIDEIATGTAPEEGQPLAQAYIEKLLEKKCRLLVTTHYGALKHFAMTHAGLRIGAMAFDVETRKPTFELRLDVPGESSALESAEQLGLDPLIIERARQLRGEVSQDLTFALSRLEASIEVHRNKNLEIEKLKAELELERERLKKRQQDFEALQRKGLSEESRNIVKSLMELREELSQAVKNATQDDLRSGGTQLFTKISDASEKMRNLSQETARGENPSQDIDDESLTQDALVEVEGLGLGNLYEVPKGPPFDIKAQFGVQVGDLKIRVTRARLKKPNREKSSQFLATKAAVAASREKKALTLQFESSAKSSTHSGSVICDVRGKTREEALRRVEVSLIELLKNDNVTVTIIHGHGSDKLKDAIRDLLESRKDEMRYRSGTWPGEGGEGVSIVERV